jgi:hypothetical protein
MRRPGSYITSFIIICVTDLLGSSCNAGSYKSGGHNSCKPCEKGTWSSAGETVCHECPAGQYTLTHLSCKDCPAGKYSDKKSDQCKSCGVGQVSCSKSSVCTTCPAGTYASHSDNQCKPCAKDTFSSSSVDYCTLCPAGSYSGTGEKECHPCSPGQHFDRKLLACVDCMPSYYSSNPKKACRKCSRGKYSTAKETSCHACLPGSTVNAGQTGCVTNPNLNKCPTPDPTPYPTPYPTLRPEEMHGDCIPSSYRHTFRVPGDPEDHYECLKCPAGTYTSFISSFCSTCPAGSTVNAGQTGCIPGGTGTGPNPQPTPFPTHAPTFEPTRRYYVDCGSSYYRHIYYFEGREIQECLKCAAGTYSYGFTDVCSVCDAGFMVNAEQTGCITTGTGPNPQPTPCPTLAPTFEPHIEVDCAPSYYRRVYFVNGKEIQECLKCAAGTYTSGFSDRCYTCDAGFMVNAEQTGCVLIP